jgi:hypothetical protein
VRFNPIFGGGEYARRVLIISLIQSGGKRSNIESGLNVLCKRQLLSIFSALRSAAYGFKSAAAATKK